MLYETPVIARQKISGLPNEVEMEQGADRHARNVFKHCFVFGSDSDPCFESAFRRGCITNHRKK
jgi:hypothetical protein